MAVPFIIAGVLVIAAGFGAEVYEFILIQDLSNRPSIVHNNTFVYNDTYVKNITHTHTFNEYRIENSTVSITLLDGSSCVIPDLIHGMQRTACTQNTDNPLAIAQFTELATGLNDTVTGVYVTIGSVSKSVLEMHEKSEEEMMQVLNSVKNMQSHMQTTFPTILQLEVEKQALQLNVDKNEAEVDRLARESTYLMTDIKELKQKLTSQEAVIDALAP